MEGRARVAVGKWWLSSSWAEGEDGDKLAAMARRIGDPRGVRRIRDLGVVVVVVEEVVVVA